MKKLLRANEPSAASESWREAPIRGQTISLLQLRDCPPLKRWRTCSFVPPRPSASRLKAHTFLAMTHKRIVAVLLSIVLCMPGPGFALAPKSVFEKDHSNGENLPPPSRERNEEGGTRREGVAVDSDTTVRAARFDAWLATTDREDITRELEFQDRLEEYAAQINGADLRLAVEKAQALRSLDEMGLLGAMDKECLQEKLHLSEHVGELAGMRWDDPNRSTAARLILVLGKAGLISTREKERIAVVAPPTLLLADYDTANPANQDETQAIFMAMTGAGIINPQDAKHVLGVRKVLGFANMKEALRKHRGASWSVVTDEQILGVLKFLGDSGCLTPEEKLEVGVAVSLEDLVKAANKDVHMGMEAYRAVKMIQTLWAGGFLKSAAKAYICSHLVVDRHAYRDVEQISALNGMGLIPDTWKLAEDGQNDYRSYFEGLRSSDYNSRMSCLAHIIHCANNGFIRKGQPWLANVSLDPFVELLTGDLRDGSARALRALDRAGCISAEQKITLQRKIPVKALLNGLHMQEHCAGSAEALNILSQIGLLSDEQKARLKKKLPINRLWKDMRPSAAFALKQLMEGGFIDKQFFRREKVAVQLGEAFPPELRGNAGNEIFWLRIYQRLKPSPALARRIADYVRPECTSLAVLAGGDGAAEVFYQTLCECIKKKMPAQSAAREVEKEMQVFYAGRITGRAMTGEMRSLARLLIYLMNTGGALNGEAIRQAFQLSGIDLIDQGNSPATFSGIARSLILCAQEKQPAESPVPLPDYKSIPQISVPVAHREDMELLLKDAAPDGEMGRTLFYKTTEGEIIALKFLKETEVAAASGKKHGSEDVRRLIHESKYFENLRQMKEAGVPLIEYHEPALIGGQSIVRVQGDDMPPGMAARLEKSVAKAATAISKVTVSRDKTGAYACMAYRFRDPNYRAYEHEAADTAQARAALKINAHELFTMARLDQLHPDIIELFHNVIQGGRDDRGRFLLMSDILRPMPERFGTGRLHAWESAVAYPNLRLNGPADFAEMAGVDELADLRHPHSEHLAHGLAAMSMENRRKFIRAHYLSNYLLACALVEGKRLKDRGLLNWKDPQMVAELAETMRQVYQTAYEAYTGEDGTQVAAIVDWERFARQMAFFMGGAYREYAARDFPEGIYGGSGRYISSGDGWGFIHRDVIVEKLGIEVKKGDEFWQGLWHKLSPYLVSAHSTHRQIDYNLCVFTRDFKERIKHEPDEPLRRKLQALYDEYGNGWRFDGIHEDLGPVNGPFPLQELVKANYVFTMFAVARGAKPFESSAMAEKLGTAANLNEQMQDGLKCKEAVELHALAPPSDFGKFRRMRAAAEAQARWNQHGKPAGGRVAALLAEVSNEGWTQIQAIESLSKRLSARLKSEEREDTITGLDEILAGESKDISPVLRKVLQAYRSVCAIDREIKVAVVVLAYQGQMTFNSPESVAGLKEIIDVKMKQLDDLFCVNRKITWEMSVVEDEVPGGRGAKDIIARDFKEDLDSGRLKGFTLARQEISRLASRKGANVVLGMREALRDGADYVIYTNPTFDIHMFNAGLLLGELASGRCDVAVGSRKMEESVRGRPWYRDAAGDVYGTIARWFLPEIAEIRDTQCAMKGFGRRALQEILPVDANGKLAPDFIYNLSYDTNLLGRAAVAGHVLKEVPVVYLKQQPVSAAGVIKNIAIGRLSMVVLAGDILGMVSGVARQRLLLDEFKKRVEHSRRKSPQDVDWEQYRWSSQWTEMAA